VSDISLLFQRLFNKEHNHLHRTPLFLLLAPLLTRRPTPNLSLQLLKSDFSLSKFVPFCPPDQFRYPSSSSPDPRLKELPDDVESCPKNLVFSHLSGFSCLQKLIFGLLLFSAVSFPAVATPHPEIMWGFPGAEKGLFQALLVIFLIPSFFLSPSFLFSSPLVRDFTPCWPYQDSLTFT